MNSIKFILPFLLFPVVALAQSQPRVKSNGCAVVVAPGGGFSELVPVEAIFFARGKHAFNMGDRSTYAAIRNWPQRMAEWMGDSGFLTK